MSNHYFGILQQAWMFFVIVFCFNKVDYKTQIDILWPQSVCARVCVHTCMSLSSHGMHIFICLFIDFSCASWHLFFKIQTLCDVTNYHFNLWSLQLVIAQLALHLYLILMVFFFFFFLIGETQKSNLSFLIKTQQIYVDIKFSSGPWMWLTELWKLLIDDADPLITQSMVGAVEGNVGALPPVLPWSPDVGNCGGTDQSFSWQTG